MNRRPLVGLLGAFSSGLVFALGLGISGMTQPAKVLGFLDPFGGAWDPSLALVMIGAIAVHAPLSWWMRTRARRAGSTGSVIGDRMALGAIASDDCGIREDQELSPISSAPSIGGLFGRRGFWVGAAIFGVGWGLGGYCPGPAVVSVVSAAPGVLMFVGAMVAGMMIFRGISQPDSTLRRRRSPIPHAGTSPG